jgi:membrane fusion protein (multidrug efflux system)
VTLLANLGNQSNIYVVPQAAVQRDAASAYVLVVGAGDKVARKDIRLVRSAGSDWIVDQGLASGDRVIVSGLQKAKVDAVVKPSDAKAGAPAAPAADAAAAPAEAAAPPAAPADGNEAKD